MSEIPEESLKELVQSGAVCATCSGIHIPDIDAAIFASTAATESGVRLPVCSCETCGVCRPFREAVEKIMAASARLDTRPFPEDAL